MEKKKMLKKAITQRRADQAARRYIREGGISGGNTDDIKKHGIWLEPVQYLCAKNSKREQDQKI